MSYALSAEEIEIEKKKKKIKILFRKKSRED
jgi:hypothetical protein